MDRRENEKMERKLEKVQEVTEENQVLKGKATEATETTAHETKKEL